MMKAVPRDFRRTRSRREGPPEDYSDDMAECLLFYFNRFQWLEVKNEIEESCDIKTWSGEEIIRALDETERMEKKRNAKVKQWACVITFQIMERLDYEERKTSGAQSSLTESTNVAQPFSTVTPDRSADRSSQRGFSAIGVKIPLSELFGNEATSEQAETVPSKYKLTDGCPSRRQMILKKSYVSSFNENTDNADWVYEILNKQTLAVHYTGTGRFPECEMEEGYDKGHLAAARNHRWCKEAFEDTFDLINMSPQLSLLNRGTWKSLEDKCRKKVKDNDIRNVHVYTGTIILDSRQFANKKAVPDRFYKMIIVENEDGTVSEPTYYQIPNDKTKIKEDIKYMNENDKKACPLLDTYKVHIDNSMDNVSQFFVRPAQRYTDEIRSVTWTGKGDGEAVHRVHIIVRMSIPE